MHRVKLPETAQISILPSIDGSRRVATRLRIGLPERACPPWADHRVSAAECRTTTLVVDQVELGVTTAGEKGTELIICLGQSSQLSRSGVAAANNCSVADSSHRGHFTTHHT
jgi:hypothetical protein